MPWPREVAFASRNLNRKHSLEKFLDDKTWQVFFFLGGVVSYQYERYHFVYSIVIFINIFRETLRSQNLS